MFEDLHEIQTALVYYEQGTEILRTKQVRNSSAYEPRPGLGNKEYTGSFGAPVSVDLYRGRVSELKALLDRPQAASHPELFVLLAMNAGNMYLYQNQYEQAERYYNQALATVRDVRDQLSEQEVLTNLAWSAIKQHKLRDAQRRLEGAFSPAPSIPGTTQLRRAVLALGVNQREQGAYTEAITNLEHAIALYRAAGDNQGTGRALAHLATAFLQQGDTDKAKPVYLEALGLNETLHDQEIAWHANGGLAKTYDRLGEYTKALHYYRTYWEVALKTGLSFQTDPGRTSYLEAHDKTFEDYARVAVNAAALSGDYGSARQVIEQCRDRMLMSLESSLRKFDRGFRGIPIPGHLPASYVLGDATAYEQRCGWTHIVANALFGFRADCYPDSEQGAIEINRSRLQLRSDQKIQKVTYLLDSEKFSCWHRRSMPRSSWDERRQARPSSCGREYS